MRGFSKIPLLKEILFLEVFMSSRKLQVVFLTIFLAGTAAMAHAATPMVYACYNKVNGITRVVSSTTTCLTFETAVSWNITGPQGPQGDPGPAGAPGAAGAAGAKGD